ncbi:MAG: hypothetical protein HY365_02645 [Candidatus Aenigmarchaeota archaeon]|nr:hypothetical protein [Candidatus Aenigmarchaeota archaeon]
MRQYLPSILFIAGITILYFLGSSPTCVTIGTHNACWGKDGAVESEFCPSGAPCVASSSDQKYNAYVSALNAACDEAKAGSYGNAALVSAVKTAAGDFFGRDTDVKELCDNAVAYLIYRQY